VAHIILLCLHRLSNRLRGRKYAGTWRYCYCALLYIFYRNCKKGFHLYCGQRNSFDFQTAKPRKDVRDVYSSCVGIARCLPNHFYESVMMAPARRRRRRRIAILSIDRSIYHTCVGNNNIIICKLSITTNNNCTHRI